MLDLGLWVVLREGRGGEGIVGTEVAASSLVLQ